MKHKFSKNSAMQYYRNISKLYQPAFILTIPVTQRLKQGGRFVKPPKIKKHQ